MPRPTPSAVSPRLRDAERSRAAILEAGAALFAEQGYDATSLAAVGVRAGLSRGTPGYFFGSKAELYHAVLEHAFADALETIRAGRLRAMRSARPPAEVLAGVVSDYVDFVAAHPNFLRLIQREALGEGASLDPRSLRQAVGSEAVTALAQELGFPPRARAQAMHLLLSMIALTWFPAVHDTTLVPAIGFDPSTPAFLAARKRHITTLLLGALPSRRATPTKRSSR
jgi:AcrR family transcriptional regulator